MTKKTHFFHPGIILKEMFLEDMEIKPATLAKALGITRSSVSKILAGERDITADMSIRLGLFFDQSFEFWLTLQKKYDLAQASLQNMKNFRRTVIPYTQISEGDFTSA